MIALLVVPALLIGVNELRKRGRTPVQIVGSGMLAAVREDDAPDSLRYEVEVVRSEPVAMTLKRLSKPLALRPGILIVGLAEPSDAPHAEATYQRVARLARAASQVTVLISPPTRTSTVGAPDWWRAGLCREHARLFCLDLNPHRAEPEAIRTAVGEAALQAQERMIRYRATTQRGR